MLINRINIQNSHKTILAGGLMQTVTLLKRKDDQQQGVVVAIPLFNCHRGRIQKTGQTIQGDMSSNHTTVWHIPRVELDRAGVQYLNALDRIVDKKGRYWQPESPQLIDVKLLETRIDLQCVQRTPPPSTQGTNFNVKPPIATTNLAPTVVPG